MSYHSSAEGVAQFIATQSPLPNTFEDFWEMVLQYRCPVIIMLTQFIEQEKLKCHNYFQSDTRPIELGNISITTKYEDSADSSIVFRRLEVTKAESKEPPLSVLHYHYQEWLDHGGAPKDIIAVGEIFRRTCHLPPTAGPILVHCSAGIGRTGTYCTIHATIHRILKGDKSALNFAETVKAFRSQRAGLVRSIDQYEFCHKVVFDVLEKFIVEGNNP